MRMFINCARFDNTHRFVLSLEGLVELGLACAVSGRAARNVVEKSCSQVVAFRLLAKAARLISLFRTPTKVALHSLIRVLIYGRQDSDRRDGCSVVQVAGHPRKLREPNRLGSGPRNM